MFHIKQRTVSSKALNCVVKGNSIEGFCSCHKRPFIFDRARESTLMPSSFMLLLLNKTHKSPTL